MTRFRSLGRNEEGASVIELALAAPLLATLLIGMVDLSNAFSAKLQLEQAAQRAIEKVEQRRATTNDAATLKTEAASAAGTDPSNVTVDFWLECNGARQTNYDSTCASGQTFARYITVQVRKSFTPTISTRFFPGANSSGAIMLSTRAGIRMQ